MGIGAVSISPTQVTAILAAQVGLELPWEYEARQETVLTAIRLPRVLATALVGAAWAGAGVAMQGLYRTPLADPALLGIGGGAALGASVAVSLAVSAGMVAEISGTALVVALAFVGAGLTAAVIFRLATTGEQVIVARMLLAGIALTAFFGALTTIVLAASRDPAVGSVAFWTLGSFSGIVGRDVLIAAVVALPSLAVLARIGPRLDALALGEREAGHLGVDVRRLTILTSGVFALLTAVAVAIAGIVAFVGLMVPGLVRRWVGAGHRDVVIGSGLLGATMLVVADVVARSLLSPVEVPVGVITALVGAPFFLWLLLRDRTALVR